MRDHAVAKKRGDPVARAIVKLVGNQKIERLQIFLQRADRAHGNNSLHAQLLHGVNVGAVVDFRRQKAVPARVPGEKSHALPFQRSHDQRVGWISERRLDAHFARLFEPRHVVQAAAADDANANFFRARAAPLCRLRLLCHSHDPRVKANLDVDHHRFKIVFALPFAQDNPPESSPRARK